MAAAHYRATQMARIKAMLEKAQSVANLAIPIDSFAQAKAALLALEQALPSMAEAIFAQGESPWSVLLPTYLALTETWGSLLKTAQAVGIAKQYKRGHAPEVAEVSLTLNQESPIGD